MTTLLVDYAPAISALGVLALLMVIQTLVLDVTGIRRKHPPGTPVLSGPDDFLFRATRAHGNSNENLPTALAILSFCFIVGASPAWINNLMLLFVAARAGHMLCYYLDLRTARSISFGVGLLAMIGMLISGFVAL
ncbi:MAPEG family protein [Litorivivens sp.]|uniref:MAPEG family protein n=1 Tax=Litorivivens sp. TaxID=2020868 RepID=UPI0035627D60